MSLPMPPSSAFLNQVLQTPAEQGLHHRIYVEHALHYMADRSEEARRFQVCALQQQIGMTQAVGGLVAQTAQLAYGIGQVVAAVDRLADLTGRGFDYLGDQLVCLQSAVEQGLQHVCVALDRQTKVLEGIAEWQPVPDSQKQFLADRDEGRQWLQRGSCHEDPKRMSRYFDDAWKRLAAANAVRHTDPGVRIDLGFLALWHRQDPDLALEHFDDAAIYAVESRPLEALCLRLVAATHYVRYRQGRVTQHAEILAAMQAARRAIELDPRHLEAQWETARYEALAGEKEAMLSRLKELLQRDRSYAIGVASDIDLKAHRPMVSDLFRRLRDECAALLGKFERDATSVQTDIRDRELMHATQIVAAAALLKDTNRKCGRWLEGI